MKIKFMFGTILSLVVLFVVFGNLGAQDAAKDGKTIFTDAKCSGCHAVSAEGIEAAKKTKAPDLSDVGTKLKADFIVKYLKKEETLNDKKHLVAFKGEDADLQILATWLESLKTAPKSNE